MKIVLVVIGKTDEAYLEQGIAKYVNRLVHYISFELKVLSDVKRNKNISFEQQKKMEGELLCSNFCQAMRFFCSMKKGNIFHRARFPSLSIKK